MTSEAAPQRRGRRARVAARAAPALPNERPIRPGLEGGRYKPLTEREVERVHETVLDALEEIGLGQAIPSMVELVTAAGGWMTDDGRLHFPRGLVEDIIARTRRSVTLCGQDPAHDMEIGGQKVYCGTGGASPSIVDLDTGLYRDSMLADLYDIARLVDSLDNIHFYWRSVVPRDMTSSLDLDLNTAYACMQGTSKHIGVSYVRGSHVEAAVEMFDHALGGEGEFRKRPFCTISCCHVVPPLRFAEDSCDALEASVRSGMPVLLVSAGQAGATSPSALAGSVVQAVAEVLAGLVFANLIDPECRAIFGTWPFVSDLRTGAMSGGSGEQALLMAACAQMANFYDLPGSVAAGMADAKIPDAQSGGEKGYTTVLAAQAGANMVQEAAGMQASLLGTALESYVIDNDLLGSVQRTVRGIEVNDETLSFDVMRAVTSGPGHYLGEAQTLDGMERDYFYPDLADRDTPAVWEDGGSLDIRERAKTRTREILSSHYPAHIDPARDAEIREKFAIHLPRELMQAGNDRW